MSIFQDDEFKLPCDIEENIEDNDAIMPLYDINIKHIQDKKEIEGNSGGPGLSDSDAVMQWYRDLMSIKAKHNMSAAAIQKVIDISIPRQLFDDLDIPVSTGKTFRQFSAECERLYPAHEKVKYLMLHTVHLIIKYCNVGRCMPLGVHDIRRLE
jgi:hypothetical protein